MTWLRRYWFATVCCVGTGLIFGMLAFWTFWAIFSVPYGGGAAITWQAAFAMVLLIVLISLVVRLLLVAYTALDGVTALERTRAQVNDRIDALERQHQDETAIHPHAHTVMPDPRTHGNTALRRYGGTEFRKPGSTEERA